MSFNRTVLITWRVIRSRAGSPTKWPSSSAAPDTKSKCWALSTPVPAVREKTLLRKLRGVGAFLWNLPFWLNEVLHTPPSKTFTRIRQRLRALRERLFRFGTPQSANDEVEDLYNLRQMPENYRKLILTNLRAFREYVPQPYAGRVTLLRARTRPLLHSHEWDLGWKRWVTGVVDIRKLPGNHENILEEPFVQTLANQLQAALDEVREQLPGTSLGGEERKSQAADSAEAERRRQSAVDSRGHAIVPKPSAQFSDVLAS